jgi:hypothetical protein
MIFSNQPNQEFIKENPDGSRYIPINSLEDLLDELNWSTRDFRFMIHKDGYASLIVSGSIELLINHDGKERSFVGAASFPIKSIEPNQHIAATLKSECIKNAATDIGVFFGRHLNDGFVPKETVEKEQPKSKPDSAIMKKFLKAVEEKDQATITMLSNIYDIKTEDAQKK